MLDNAVRELVNKIAEIDKDYGTDIFEEVSKVNDNEINYFRNWFTNYSKINIDEYIELINYINGIKNPRRRATGY